jgi:ribosomal protein S18 acetylase RimI-like enzyme
MTLSDGVEIVPFEPRFAESFARLNYDWIERFFRVEPYDRELLENPIEQIINKGGQIYIALLNGEPVGTVALLFVGENTYELAKMAVSPEAQGRGIGRKLMAACIEHARFAGASEILLESNTLLDAAIHLYRRFGFVEIPLDPNSHYSRVNIKMRLALPREGM